MNPRLVTVPPIRWERTRLTYVLAAGLSIVLGLLWRSGLVTMPGFLVKYGGDALWSMVVFFGLGTLFTRVTTLRVALMAVAFSWAIEFLQLYHAPWIDSIRSTLLGRLVLGSTFNSPDLVAYVIGVALAALADRVLAQRNPTVKP